MWFSNSLDKVKLGDKKGERSWVQLLRPGKWKHDTYGELEFGDKKFSNMIKNFDNNVRRIDLAIDTEHKPEEGACAWIRKLENRGKKEGLWALVEWTTRGVELVKDGIYKYLSVEFDNTWTDEESGKKYKDVLFGAALTNRPFIKGMAPVNLSEFKTELKEDEEIVKMIKLSEEISKINLNDEDSKMKKCPKCDKDVEPKDGKCPDCGASMVAEKKAEVTHTEEGDDAKINQKTKAKGDEEGVKDQAEKREKEDKKDNKNNVAASGVKAGEEDNADYFLDEETGQIIKVLAEDEEKKEDKKDEKKEKKDKEEDEGDINLDEGSVMIASKKLAERERETIRVLSESPQETRQVLSDNLQMLRESRVEKEKADIETMLNEHFLDGKMSVKVKDIWKEILFNEASQVDVAVYKLSEDGKDRFMPLVQIVERILEESPPIVELRELAKSGDDGVRKTLEEKEADEAGVIAKRITHKYNEDEKAKKERNKKMKE